MRNTGNSDEGLDPVEPRGKENQLLEAGSGFIVISLRTVLLTLSIVCLSTSCRHTPPFCPKYTFGHQAMGTDIEIQIYSRRPARIVRHAADQAFAEIDALEKVFSDYNQDSELMRLNRTAGREKDVRLSKPLFHILQRAQEISRQSDGAFDVTVGPHVLLWRQAVWKQQLPPKAERRARSAAVGFRHLHLDTLRRTARLEVPRMRLDLGGIAKGTSADAALAGLRKKGFPIALINLGGDMAVGDPPPGRRGWRIEIQGGDRVLQLARCGVATSGASYRFLQVEGVRYSHIVDPRTGLGVTHADQTTVIAPSGELADAWASAFSVLGRDTGHQLADKLDGRFTVFWKRQIPIPSP